MQDFRPKDADQWPVFGGLYAVAAADLGKLFRRFDVCRVAPGTLYEKLSAELFFVIAGLYPFSLLGSQPVGQSLIALVPDYALLIAIRHFLFVRRTRLGKALVWLGVLIDLGFTAFFVTDPAFTGYDRGLAMVQSLTWLLFGITTHRIDQRIVTHDASSQLSAR